MRAILLLICFSVGNASGLESLVGTYQNTKDSEQKFGSNEDLTIDADWRFVHAGLPSEPPKPYQTNRFTFSKLTGKGKRWEARGILSREKYSVGGECVHDVVFKIRQKKGKLKTELIFPSVRGNNWGSWGSACTESESMKEHQFFTLRKTDPIEDIPVFEYWRPGKVSKFSGEEKIAGLYRSLDDPKVELSIVEREDGRRIVNTVSDFALSTINVENESVQDTYLYSFQDQELTFLAESKYYQAVGGRLKQSQCSGSFDSQLKFARVGKNIYSLLLTRPQHYCSGTGTASTSLWFEKVG